MIKEITHQISITGHLNRFKERVNTYESPLTRYSDTTRSHPLSACPLQTLTTQRISQSSRETSDYAPHHSLQINVFSGGIGMMERGDVKGREEERQEAPLVLQWLEIGVLTQRLEDVSSLSSGSGSLLPDIPSLSISLPDS
ncbi:unnamed protein product [Pleuronectes platessa]|uniref:Uncharacterized protein n=1 Tax=Pleuronectes platessa TaxID=8262 RepID=A0A9N7TQ00_PLEPL|nr:unnamed protein product [Pleuronectes platessa]